jgi:hypothetical protein
VEYGGEAVLDQIGGDHRRDAHASDISEKMATIHASPLQDLKGNLQHRSEVAQPPRTRNTLASLPAGNDLAGHRRMMGDLA